jgi:hypothetical protein
MGEEELFSLKNNGVGEVKNSRSNSALPKRENKQGLGSICLHQVLQGYLGAHLLSPHNREVKVSNFIRLLVYFTINLQNEFVNYHTLFCANSEIGECEVEIKHLNWQGVIDEQLGE